MATRSLYCPVLKDHIARVTDFEDSATAVICPAYQKPTGICRLKRSVLAHGPLSQFLERMDEGTL